MNELSFPEIIQMQQFFIISNSENENLMNF